MRSAEPYLGYVTRPLRVVKIEDFTADEVAGAAQERSRFDVALVFSTKYEPPRPLLERWRAWERIKTRFFGFHRDLPPGHRGADSGRARGVHGKERGSVGGGDRNRARV